MKISFFFVNLLTQNEVTVCLIPTIVYMNKLEPRYITIGIQFLNFSTGIIFYKKNFLSR